VADQATYRVQIPHALQELLEANLGAIASAAVTEGMQFGQQVIMADTPTDETHARQAWTITKAPTPADPSGELSNNLPYILALEYGSEDGKKPWPKPGEKTEYSRSELNAGNITSTQAPAGMVRKNLPAIQAITERAFYGGLPDV
jgi:hypothetical protein